VRGNARGGRTEADADDAAADAAADSAEDAVSVGFTRTVRLVGDRSSWWIRE